MKNPNSIKKMLCDDIKSMEKNIQLFVKNPEKDFSRNRKLPFQKIMGFILALEKETITNELFKYFGYRADIPTASSFCQQRAKILPDALRNLLYWFNRHFKPKLFRGFRSLGFLYLFLLSF